MRNFNGEIVIKPKYPTEETLMEIGEHIHQQLVGNMDYVNCNIGISVGKVAVLVWIDECEGEIPEIKF